MWKVTSIKGDVPFSFMGNHNYQSARLYSVSIKYHSYMIKLMHIRSHFLTVNNGCYGCCYVTKKVYHHVHSLEFYSRQRQIRQNRFAKRLWYSVLIALDAICFYSRRQIAQTSRVDFILRRNVWLLEEGWILVRHRVLVFVYISIIKKTFYSYRVTTGKMCLTSPIFIYVPTRASLAVETKDL